MNQSDNRLLARNKITLAIVSFILILIVPLIFSISEKKYYKTNCIIASAVLNIRKKEEKVISRKLILEAINEYKRQILEELPPTETFKLKKISFPYLDDKSTDYIKLTIYFSDSTGMNNYLNKLVVKLNENEYIKNQILEEQERAVAITEELHLMATSIKNFDDNQYISLWDTFNQIRVNEFYLKIEDMIDKYKSYQQQDFDFYLVLPDKPLIYPANFSIWILIFILIIIGGTVSYLIVKLV
jgi:hypothetical protein